MCAYNSFLLLRPCIIIVLWISDENNKTSNTVRCDIYVVPFIQKNARTLYAKIKKLKLKKNLKKEVSY